MQITVDQIRATTFGHIIADAMGVPVEFKSRQALQQDPVTDYRGYGTHHQPPGTWSDDTSMLLAGMDSLTHGLDYEDLMQRFSNWARDAAYTATDVVFDIGIATRSAIRKFIQGRPALESGCTGENENGNGSLMRIIPAILYCLGHLQGQDTAAHLQIIHDTSRVTHAHMRSQVGCGIYYFLLRGLLQGGREAIPAALEAAGEFYQKEPELAAYSRIFRPDFAQLPEGEISGSGYVVHTLEAAVWCLLTTESYAQCILKAVNLGRDTDTVAAVAGGLAGALYGMEGIPQRWHRELIRFQQVEDYCAAFFQAL